MLLMLCRSLRSGSSQGCGRATGRCPEQCNCMQRVYSEASCGVVKPVGQVKANAAEGRREVGLAGGLQS